MILESFSENLLKLFSVKEFQGGLPKLTQFIKPGDFFNTTVLEYFPKKK